MLAQAAGRGERFGLRNTETTWGACEYNVVRGQPLITGIASSTESNRRKGLAPFLIFCGDNDMIGVLTPHGESEDGRRLVDPT